MKIGFDPTFLDVFVYSLDANGRLIPKLPNPGHHVRNSLIKEVAGGNGVNVARTLARLGHDPALVIPYDDYFMEVLSLDPHLKNLERHRIHDCGSNRTIAVIWGEGEIQFNHTSNNLEKRHWTQDVHHLWTESSFHVFLNWGLNSTSNEWVTCQLLALSGIKNNELKELSKRDAIELAMEVSIECDHPILIDTGRFDHHSEKEELVNLFAKLAGLDQCIVLMNEEEAPVLQEIPMQNYILHTPERIKAKFKSETIHVDVPPLKEALNFVGAGDAFLAGIIDGLKLGVGLSKDLLLNGVRVAQKHIMDTFD